MSKKAIYQKSIELLNEAVADELSAVHQYMYFHFHCDDQGLDLLANLFRRTAIEEMMHIERIAERVLFMGGDVVMKPADDVLAITDVRKMIDWAVESESGAIEMYNKSAQKCAEHGDANSRKLFESLVDDEERHFSQFDDEHDNLERYGDNYLALQSIERSRSAGSTPEPGPGA